MNNHHRLSILSSALLVGVAMAAATSVSVTLGPPRAQAGTRGQRDVSPYQGRYKAKTYRRPRFRA